MKALTPLGRIDLLKYLQATKGQIDMELIDAGMIRPLKAGYSFAELKDNKLLITRLEKRGKNIEATVNRFIDLTPEFIVFAGMYDGDGNKTNNIGFAQNEHHLQNFVTEHLKQLFGDSFDEEVTILEDSLYFQGGEGLEKYNKLKKQTPSLIDREIYEKILADEFKEKFGEDTPTYTKYVVSPLKGARSAGQSSYEIIRNLKNSRNFLPLFLSIIKIVINTIFRNQKYLNGDINSGLEWFVEPKKLSLISLDTEKLIKECCVYSTSSGTNKYVIVAVNDNVMTLKKLAGNEFKVFKKIPLSPLLCAMIGLYWAEGTTTKSKLFTFHESKENLVIGFNSSEEISLNIFLDGIGCIFPNIDDVFAYWIIKIGTKYFAETNALSFRIMVPPHRAGPLGQGICHSVETSAEIKKWGIAQSSDMRKYSDYFRHLEFTGNGIPRIDVRCKSAAAPFLFTIMRLLTFERDNFEEYLV